MRFLIAHMKAERYREDDDSYGQKEVYLDEIEQAIKDFMVTPEWNEDTSFFEIIVLKEEE